MSRRPGLGRAFNMRAIEKSRAAGDAANKGELVRAA